MILNSPTISGSLTVTGNIITSGSITISGSIASASYATNAELLDGLDSTAFATTGAYSATSASLYATSASLSATSGSLSATSGSLSATSGSLSTASGSFDTRVTALEVTGSALSSSLLTVSGSGYATSASLSTASGSFDTRVATIESKYATTGSNTFTSTQVVSGSILQSGSFTTTGTIIAQTINVQTVTSSVVYSSGSNVFGNDIGNSQRFTGSVLITGSLTIAGASSATSYSGTTIYGSTVACSPIGCFATSCATSFIGGTMSGTTIYGSTAVCSPVGKFTSCIDITSAATTGTALRINGDNLTTGTALSIVSNDGSASHTGNLVEICNAFNAGAAAKLMCLYQGDDGDGIYINMARGGVGLTVDGAGGGYSAIFNNGNVGIGTTAPSMKLSIGDGTGTSNQYIRMFSSATDMYIGQSASLFGLGTIQAIVTDSTYNNAFGIGTLSNTACLVFATNNIPRITITGGGNVGIGMCTPSEKLTVYGAVMRLEGAAGVSPFAIANNNSCGFRIYDYNAGLDRLVIATTGAATFKQATATTLTVDATDTCSYSTLANSENGIIKSYWTYINSTFATTARRNYMEVYNTVGGVSIWTAGVKALDINTSQATTFSGDLCVSTAGNTSVLFDGTNPTLTLRRNNNGNASAAINFKGSSAVKWQMGTNQATGLGFEVNEGDAIANRFYIAPGGAATFSGNALTVLGDNPALTVSTSNTTLYSYINLSGGTSSNYIYTLANSYATTGPYVAGALTLVGTTSGGISIAAQCTSGLIRFYTCATERMRITSDGFTKITNTGAYYSATASNHELRSDVSGDWNTAMTSTGGNPYGLLIGLITGCNGTGNEFIAAYTNNFSALKFKIASNGGIYNYQANDSNLSDIRTKKDITPLESYWDKFKSIEIVKFKYKNQEHNDYNIGVIAQQVEEIAPEFVNTEGWETKGEGSESPLKSIYTADLYHTTIKVLQEAMGKIETQQCTINTLKTCLGIS